MSSNLRIEYENIEERWKEVDRLIAKAKEVKESDLEFYNTLCRSASVFMSAHFEGTIKDVIKAIIKDCSEGLKFSELPICIKRTYAQYFFGGEDSKNDTTKLNDLIQKLDSTNIQIDDTAFLLANKNPKSSAIKTIAGRFGIEDFFGYLEGSKVELVFENNLTESGTFYDLIRSKVFSNIEIFPYKNDYSELEISKRAKGERSKITLYETFIEDFLKIRHSIVHGNTLGNSLNDTMLTNMKLKIQVLMFAYTIIITRVFKIRD